jgi:hypothetical protein
LIERLNEFGRKKGKVRSGRLLKPKAKVGRIISSKVLETRGRIGRIVSSEVLRKREVEDGGQGKG